MTWCVDTKELIASSITPLAKATPVDFRELQTVTAMSLSVAEQLHAYIIEL